ncbi:DUF4190 domain-containing protein [Microbacterium sp. AGC62]
MTYPPQYPQPYIVQLQRAPSNGQAVGAMVLGIIAIAVGVWALVPFLGIVAALLGFVPAVLAVIFGHLGFNTSVRMQGIGRSQAITGFVLGYVTLAIILGTTVFWFAAIGASNYST